MDPMAGAFDVESAFANMDRASLNGSGQYFEEGRFLLRLKAAKGNNGYKGPCFIAEFEVLDSSNPECAVGATRSFVVKLRDNDYAMGDIKALVFALALDTDPKAAGSYEKNPELHKLAAEITKAICDDNYAKKIEGTKAGMIAKELVGCTVKLETFKKPTRPKPGQTSGGVFTVHNWSPDTAAA